jgi:hypothetical protein
VVNDSPEPVSDKLRIKHLKFNGDLRGQLETDVTIGPGQARRCLVTTDLGPVYLRTEFLHTTLGDRDATYLLTAERYLHLPNAKLTARAVGDKIEISTDVFARTVSLEMNGITGAAFEDNFFDMVPGQKRIISVIYPEDGARLVTISALNAEPVRVNVDLK